MNIIDHRDHEWEKRDCYIYCKECEVRLYKGRRLYDKKDKEEFIKDFEALINSSRRELKTF